MHAILSYIFSKNIFFRFYLQIRIKELTIAAKKFKKIMQYGRMYHSPTLIFQGIDSLKKLTQLCHMRANVGMGKRRGRIHLSTCMLFFFCGGKLLIRNLMGGSRALGILA